MRKHDSLRQALVAALPNLAKDPGNFLIFIKSGRIVSRWRASPAFEYRYRLTIGLLDFPGDANAVFVALIAWVQANQSELLAPGKEDDGIVFSADILDPGSADISIELELSEALTATRRLDGGWDLAYAEEATNGSFGLDALSGLDPPAPLGEVWLGGTKLAG